MILKQFDKDDRNLLKNIIYAFGIKGMSLFVSFFSMPMYIKFFDNDIVLGLWYTVLSMLSWISVCDLGVGNGFRNQLTTAIALKDEVYGKKLISSTYFALTIIILPIIIVLIVFVWMVDINTILNVSKELVGENSLKMALTILLSGIIFSFVLKLINNVIYALQKSYLNNVLALVTSVIPIVFVLLFHSGNPEQNLINLSVVHVFAISVPLIVATIFVFTQKELKKIKFSFASIDFKVAKDVLFFGSQFFLAQIFFMILMATNEFFISRFFSPEHVVTYSIYYRVFTTIGSLFTLALTPVWSKVTKDLAEKKYKKILNMNKMLYLSSLVSIFFELLMVVGIQLLFDIWLREATIKADYVIAFVFAMYGGLYVLNIAVTTVANGIGDLKSQIVFYGVGAVLKIPFAFFVSSLNLDWWFIILYNGIIVFAFAIYQMVAINKKLVKLTEGERG